VVEQCNSAIRGRSFLEDVHQIPRVLVSMAMDRLQHAALSYNACAHTWQNLANQADIDEAA